MHLKAVPTAFAVLDILGYGKLMSREPDEVFMLIKELLQASFRNWHIQRDLDKFSHFSGSEYAPTIKYLQFSDTLLIWLQVEELVPEPMQSPSQLVQSICYVTSFTLASFIFTGIPLRGAIGFGPTFISREPLFLVGSKLCSTIKLEKKQIWVGAALHESAANVLPQNMLNPFIIQYLVPMKPSDSPEPQLAVDWVSCLQVNHNLIPPWERLFDSNKTEVRQKRLETQKFYKEVRSQSRIFPVYHGERTILEMQQRLTSILSKK